MRILDLSRGIAGAYCAQLLALTSAEVVRIPLSHPGLDAPSIPDDLVQDLLDRGKAVHEREIVLPEMLDDLLALTSSVDAIVEDWGAGTLEACGLTEAALRERVPSLVLTRVSEFGQEGPWSAWTGSELVNLAAGGLLFLTGTWDRPPVQLAPYQAQMTAGVLGALATSAALLAGEPVTIDLSKQDAIAAMITPALSEYVYQGTIPARDGTVAGMTRIEMAKDRWVYAGPSAPGNADYARFADFLGIPELAEERFSTADRRMENWEEHQALILPRIKERTAREWIDAAEQWRLTFGHVQTTTDLLESEVLLERGFFAPFQSGDQTARAPLAPYLVNGARPDALAAAPVAPSPSLHEETHMDLPPLNEKNAPPGTPLRSYTITYTPEMVETFLSRTGEPADAYMLDGAAVVPPGMLTGTYGRLIHETFFYETGVHVSTEMLVTRLPRVGEAVTVSGQINDLYERNGSKYVAFGINVADESQQPLAQIEHVSIYKLAGRAPGS